MEQWLAASHQRRRLRTVFRSWSSGRDHSGGQRNSFHRSRLSGDRSRAAYPFGLACAAIGAIAMLSQKRRGRHSNFGTSISGVCWRCLRRRSSCRWCARTWVAGTSPAMTRRVVADCSLMLAPFENEPGPW